jgi:hypothetical protein
MEETQIVKMTAGRDWMGEITDIKIGWTAHDETGQHVLIWRVEEYTLLWAYAHVVDIQAPPPWVRGWEYMKVRGVRRDLELLEIVTTAVERRTGTVLEVTMLDPFQNTDQSGKPSPVSESDTPVIVA